ncbi:hypothetical protein K440DRAFT_555695 [Wilcoxina mikolae CBS 423.85]|nr:hypothetical protein K440DRAFT_555695 [Wilcoxina mikolae CBS 423.85]
MTQYSDSTIYSPHLISSINHAWSLIDKYYGLADLQPSLYAVVALHPDMKLKYFRNEWKAGPEWIEAAVSTATYLWEKTGLIQTDEVREVTGLLRVLENETN